MTERSKTGTVVHKEGTYFLEIEGKHHPIPVGANVHTQLSELVGKKVEIVYSEPKSFVVGLIQAGTGSVRPPRIICYFPADPWAVGVVEEAARVGLAKQFLNEGVLSKETFEKLGASEQTKTQSV